MSKRTADHQLTKSEYEAEDEDTDVQEQGTWKPADDEQLKKRNIVKARRPTASATADSRPAMPVFRFGGATVTETPAAAAAAETVVAVPATVPAPAAAAEPEAPKPKTFAELAAAQASTGWECPVCEVRNKSAAVKCAACEEPKPGAANGSEAKAAPEAEAPKFTFGGAPTPTVTATGAESAVATSTATAPSFSTGGFSFGTGAFTFGAAAVGDGAKGFMFNPFGGATAATGESGATTAASAPLFTFGSSVDKSAPTTFGALVSSGDTKSDFSGGVAPSFPSTTALEASSGPNELFVGKQAESTGEESDTIHHRQQCKVFTMQVVSDNTAAADNEAKVSSNKPADSAAAQPHPKWVEIGVGELHLNTYSINDITKARLILRTDKTHRLVLNTPLVSSLSHSFALQGDKYVKIASVDVENNNKLSQYLFKVSSKQEAQTLLEQLSSVAAEVK